MDEEERPVDFGEEDLTPEMKKRRDKMFREEQLRQATRDLHPDGFYEIERGEKTKKTE
jgi:hypothetical protein